jgi:hypothetical protein
MNYPARWDSVDSIFVTIFNSKYFIFHIIRVTILTISSTKTTMQKCCGVFCNIEAA